jgi:hypothetical protein
MATPQTYCIDTSSLLVWFVDTYPPTIFPGLQTRIEELFASQRLRSPKTVRDEIRSGDECHTWCKAHAELFIEESTVVQRVVRRLMAIHQNLAKPHKEIGGADPFIIAMAKVEGPHVVIVADEHPGSDENRKIPYVCTAEGVQCISFQTMMKEEGWTFR